MENQNVLGIDIGGSKIAWGYFDEDGHLLDHKQKPTPVNKEDLLKLLNQIIAEQSVVAVGIGVAGTISADHQDTIVCTNMPQLSHLDLVKSLSDQHGTLIALDNDGRCALIGEAWQGAAKDLSSAVMLTLGTGVGGAVMQKTQILPHPVDLSLEISRLSVDPSDVFPSATGMGTVEAYLGGRNLEARLNITLADVSSRAHAGDPAALKIWEQISYFFINCVKAIFNSYSCKNIIIGGKGSKDLDLFMGGETTPCPVVAAVLGELAGLYGAARIALDLYEEKLAEDAEWGTSQSQSL